MNNDGDPYKCNDALENYISTMSEHCGDNFEEYLTNFWATYEQNDVNIVIDTTNNT